MALDISCEHRRKQSVIGDMNIEMIELPKDSNPMIRLKSSSYITASLLAQIKQKCMEMFNESSHMTKAKWHRLGCYAEAILEDRKLPYNGLPVIGPFIGRDIELPEPGEIVTLNAGIEVFSNMPRLLGKTHYERISRKIRVSEVSAGYVNLHNRGEIVDPMIHWQLNAGFAGWTSVKNTKEKGLSYLNLEMQG